jgi:hypothetical protein
MLSQPDDITISKAPLSIGTLFTAMLILVATFIGCSTPGIRVTVISEPDGAYITSEDDGPYGESGIVPVVAFWGEELLESPSNRDKRGCLRLTGFTATWVSGAVTKVPVVQHCEKSTNGDYHFVMKRDMNFPGLEKDLQFALSVQAQSAQTAQVQAAEAMALSSMWSAARVGQPTQRPINCSSYASGSTIQTNCQ